MKKIISILISLVVIFSSSSISNAVSITEPKPLLSEMSESECIAFIKESGITLPPLYDDEEAWGSFVQEYIRIFEENPNAPITISYTVFANLAREIRNAVKNYYGITNNENFQPAFSLRATYPFWLEYSTVYGDWDPNFENYNCYSFALGITDKPYDPGMIFAIAQGPEYFLNWYLDVPAIQVEDIRDEVILDLGELGKARVIYNTSDIYTANLCTNESVICVRKGPIDYHFMKYTTDGWLHKPGQTQVLKYNTTPNYMDIWTNEAVVMGIYVEPNRTYNSTIYFISYNGHDWQYTYYNNNFHRKNCTICGDIFTEACDYEYSYAGNGMHTATCVDCGHTVTSACSSFATTSNGDRTHDISCTVCGNVETEVCRLEYTNLTNTTHSASCTECDYAIASQACQLNYRSKDGQTHTVSCTKCENRRTQNCSYRYVSHGDNTHSYLCSLCGYVKIDHALCLFNANNICRTCGTPKNGAVINKQEEVTLE